MNSIEGAVIKLKLKMLQNKFHHQLENNTSITVEERRFEWLEFTKVAVEIWESIEEEVKDYG
ncbi:MAG: hypothetical protein EHM25_00350 [Nitrosopumilales archaeon]|nr:MAG: hypothetical protein EHM25_00350 [Nitrosopumilales archaeon]